MNDGAVGVSIGRAGAAKAGRSEEHLTRTVSRSASLGAREAALGDRSRAVRAGNRGPCHERSTHAQHQYPTSALPRTACFSLLFSRTWVDPRGVSHERRGWGPGLTNVSGLERHRWPETDRGPSEPALRVPQCFLGSRSARERVRDAAHGPLMRPERAPRPDYPSGVRWCAHGSRRFLSDRAVPSLVIRTPAPRPAAERRHRAQQPNRFPCEYVCCDYDARTRLHLAGHVRNEHVVPNPFDCPWECGHRAASITERNRHALTECDRREPLLQHVCSYGFVAKSKKGFGRHVSACDGGAGDYELPRV